MNRLKIGVDSVPKVADASKFVSAGTKEKLSAAKASEPPITSAIKVHLGEIGFFASVTWSFIVKVKPYIGLDIQGLPYTQAQLLRFRPLLQANAIDNVTIRSISGHKLLQPSRMTSASIDIEQNILSTEFEIQPCQIMNFSQTPVILV